MDNFILDNKIRETLDKKAEEAGADAFAAQRIRAKVYSKLEEAEHMKKRNWKKTAIVAAAICVLGSMTVLGLGKTVTVTGGSSHADIITSYEEAEAKQNSLDSQVKMIEKFANGYEFDFAVPVHSEGTDKDGYVTGKETTLRVSYVRDGAKEISLSVSRITMGEVGEPDAVLALEDGTELHYSTLVNKFVPVGYKMTEEEQKLMEEGKLNVAEGADEIEIMPSSSVIWVQDEITYHLFTFSQDMSADEMLAMAQEIAESE